MTADYSSTVFINCPFDEEYQEIFNAIIFTVIDCGFVPKCALEDSDSGKVRIEKLFQYIKDSKYGIHDISRTELDKINQLPRFNMPLELGIFFGAVEYGSNKQKSKKCLILDSEVHRYQKFISDIAGQDIRVHGNKPREAVRQVRHWLVQTSNRTSIPPSTLVWTHYEKFNEDLSDISEDENLDRDDLLFKERSYLISYWLKNNVEDR